MDWEQLMQEHGASLLLYARQWCNSHADAEEAVQDGFVRFWRAWQDGRIKVKEPTGLLYLHVKRSALDRLRGNKRRTARHDKAADILYEEQPWFESTLDRDERRAALEQAMQTLPSEQREVLVMKIWGELTFREIGETLAIPQDTAASRYRYALKALGRNLQHREEL
jgi:RNA polymerase sigma-70 factor (ECF subfamily)